jgi:hypothetical protein
MECRNHPGVEAEDRCVGCMELFCANCLVFVRGQKYCSSCKVMAIGDRMPVVERATMPCKEADEALRWAIIGIFCFGIILGPIAISKALKARRLIEANPALTGYGKTTATLIIAALTMLLWIGGIFSRFNSGGNP